MVRMSFAAMHVSIADIRASRCVVERSSISMRMAPRSLFGAYTASSRSGKPRLLPSVRAVELAASEPLSDCTNALDLQGGGPCSRFPTGAAGISARLERGCSLLQTVSTALARERGEDVVSVQPQNTRRTSKRQTWGLLLAAVMLAAVLVIAGSATASSGGPMATGSVEFQGFGTISISLAAQGTPVDATGWMEYRRVAEGFDANSGGPVTCYLQIGNVAYFGGEFRRTFLSGPTEIRFFNGVVVDGEQAGEPDQASVMLGADAPIACDEPGTMTFLFATTTPVNRGNIVVH
jgi:hypothetical protein